MAPGHESDQTELARRTSLKQSRIRDLELGRRQPNQTELRLLAAALHVPVRDLAGEPVARSSSARGTEFHKLFGSRRPELRARRDRPTWVRLLHASRHHRSLYLPLAQGIKQRPDYPAIQRYLREAVADSRYEVLLWMQCLNRQFGPARVSPLRCNFRAVPVFDEQATGDLLWPALVCRQPFPVILLPQLTVVARGEFCRLDLAIGARLGRRRLWVNGEVDGEGHDPTGNERRLGLPTLRLTPEDVLAQDAVDRLLARVLAL